MWSLRRDSLISHPQPTLEMRVTNWQSFLPRHTQDNKNDRCRFFCLSKTAHLPYTAAKKATRGTHGAPPIHHKFAADGEVTKRQSENSKQWFHVSCDRLRSQLPLVSSQSSRLRMLLRA